MRIRNILPASLALALAAVAAPVSPAAAAGGGGHVEDVSFSFEGPFGVFDKAQLQRGLQVYNEVCSACHGLKFVAFRTLGDETGPGYDEEQVKAFAAMYEVPDPEGEPGDTRPGKPFDHFPANTSAGAPDLSLMAKARAGFHGPAGLGINQIVKGMGGPEYIYSLLIGYTGEEKTVAGSTLYENHAFPGGWISMAPPLEDGRVEYADGTPATKEQMAKDVAAFLMWAAEPKMVERKQAGARNFAFVVVLAVLLYLTNKKLWSKVKKGGGVA
ncbi:cytochrome c1 [Oceanicella actignis]|uniref:cytochrome c1 n=1 Tax=Oceanicella actignis TaxID=1189325 RepID=UPI0011E65ED9|nr:cytochrome c1 [Oceanicella actignis]TYO89143.1 ubiquinol-cytochrome c reductase cytochrome c1 subunit [Oceanicella actignis]